MQLVVVCIQARVEAEELELGAGAVAGWRIENVVVGRTQGQLSELPVFQLACPEAHAEGVVALVVPYNRHGRFFWRRHVIDLAALSQEVMGERRRDFPGPAVGLAFIANIIVGGVQYMGSLFGWQRAHLIGIGVYITSGNGRREGLVVIGQGREAVGHRGGG